MLAGKTVRMSAKMSARKIGGMTGKNAPETKYRNGNSYGEIWQTKEYEERDR